MRKHIKELGGTPRLIDALARSSRCAARPSAPCAITCTRPTASCLTRTRSSGTRRGGCRCCSPPRRWPPSAGADADPAALGARVTAPPTVREVAGRRHRVHRRLRVHVVRAGRPAERDAGAAGRLVAGARRARAASLAHRLLAGDGGGGLGVRGRVVGARLLLLSPPRPRRRAALAAGHLLARRRWSPGRSSACCEAPMPRLS